MKNQNKNVCYLNGCESKSVAFEVCDRHYKRLKRHQPVWCETEGCDVVSMPRRNICKACYAEATKKRPRITQAMMKCKIDGCKNPSRAKNICQLHLGRIHNGVDLYAPITSRVRNIGKTCKVNGCDEDAKIKHLCILHYRRYKSMSDLDTPLKPKGKRHSPKPCKIDGCEYHAEGWGMCYVHYRRKKEGRDLYAPIKKRMRNIGVQCKNMGCENEAAVKHLCKTHYNRSISGRLVTV